MGPLTGSSKKIDAALSGTKIPLDIVKELADLIPADCVGPILGVTLKIIEMIEVSSDISLYAAMISDSQWLDPPVVGCENEQRNLFGAARGPEEPNGRRFDPSTGQDRP